jgi:hypothetical protein
MVSSENKKRKLKNSHQVPSGLKDKGKGMKGLSFYTSAKRQENKRMVLQALKDEDLYFI